MASSNAKILRVGVVGAGRIGAIHIRNMTGTRFVQIAAVCSVIPAELKWAANEVPEAKLYSEFDEFVKDPKIDAVWICSPTLFHEEHLIKSLQNGKHVFCEKPLSAEVEIAEKMVKYAAQYPHLKVACGFPRRYAEVFTSAREIIASGAIGDVINVRLQTTDNYNPSKAFLKYIENSGGIFVDCNIHDIDVGLYLVGGDKIPLTAYATGTSTVYPQFKQWGDSDSANGLVTFEEDLIFSIYGSRDNQHGHHTSTEIFGTKGRLMINSEPRGLNIDISDENGTKMIRAEDHMAMFPDAFKQEVIGFRDWILYNKEANFNLKDAVTAVKIGKALQESLRTHRLVSID